MLVVLETLDSFELVHSARQTGLIIGSQIHQIMLQEFRKGSGFPEDESHDLLIEVGMIHHFHIHFP